MPNSNPSHFNLIVSADPSAWEGNVATFSRDRFLEFTYGNRFEKRDSHEHFNYLKEMEKYPCLFLYEKQTVITDNLSVMGYIGYIRQPIIDNLNILFNLDKRDTLSLHDVELMSSALQVNNTHYGELNRTHWAVKNIDLFEVIERFRPNLENQTIVTRPKVFFSYSWEEEYTSQIVESLYPILINNGIDVTYDKRDLKAGHNIAYFMESVQRDNFTKIYVFCDDSYIRKANGSSDGVGVETNLLKRYVKSHPKQTKVIPISLDGSFNVPIFLDNINGFKLSFSNWDHDVNLILNDIFNS
ncbi:TIR domain-containing protein [Enterococcus casseliflavus]|uniref:toll/interleukin-1 receptor domain-containing protein n=1 Tax=Enterococcus casseliflavus TaxID=37734 RepID=UPI001C8C8891|nr:toll/interleukin-1 receptor domain-containing protein [Enterococcus casseliflavus]MBX9115931.1 TIR domain-containing protein [Enterococcus casseliflavus]MBX9126339.1 TIR domain-containing protein [Enterococcus casseliflavus]